MSRFRTGTSIKDQFAYPIPFLDGVSDARHIIGMGRTRWLSDEEIQKSLELRRRKWAHYALALGRHQIHEFGETLRIPRTVQRPDYEFEIAVLLDRPTQEGWTRHEADPATLFTHTRNFVSAKSSRTHLRPKRSEALPRI